MRKLWVTLLLSLAVLYGWRQCAPIRHGPGILVTEAPRQSHFTTPQKDIQKDGWMLTPLATYAMTARVLAVARYSDGPDGQLSPYDLALGWGPMSDTSVLERLDIRQSHRFYHWTYWGEKPPAPEADIISHSANVHLIPADAGVLARLKSIRTGSVVTLSGLLVEARHPAGAEPWRSSLVRTDTGKGACEIIYVRSLIVK